VSIGVGTADSSGLGGKLAAVGAGLVALVVLMAGAAGAGIASLLGGGGSAPSPTATSAIPPVMLALYQEAASTCPGLPWTVLAAIGTVESDNGQSTAPGVRSGVNFAGVASGPMQFLPSTFAAYDEPVPPGGVSPPDIYDPTDAAYAAARLLCANGAEGGADLPAAVFAFNHSDSYVAQVLSLAQSYGQAQGQIVAGGIAVDWALAQVGTPYIWGGETPGVGFDCSGLVQAAYKVVGITLPRVAQDQFDAGPQLPPGMPLEPGDLVFFGGSGSTVGHVGIYVGTEGGQAMMVDAPHTGANVRVEPFPTTVGAQWGGGDVYVGATRPGL
jgi:cell wall-associated NlpC family hydrolase